jgi:hypothetical protein
MTTLREFKLSDEERQLGEQLCPCNSGLTRARCNPSHTPAVPLPGAKWVEHRSGDHVRLARRLDGTQVLQVFRPLLKPLTAIPSKVRA